MFSIQKWYEINEIFSQSYKGKCLNAKASPTRFGVVCVGDLYFLLLTADEHFFNFSRPKTKQKKNSSDHISINIIAVSLWWVYFCEIAVD